MLLWAATHLSVPGIHTRFSNASARRRLVYRSGAQLDAPDRAQQGNLNETTGGRGAGPQPGSSVGGTEAAEVPVLGHSMINSTALAANMTWYAALKQAVASDRVIHNIVSDKQHLWAWLTDSVVFGSKSVQPDAQQSRRVALIYEGWVAFWHMARGCCCSCCISTVLRRCRTKAWPKAFLLVSLWYGLTC